MHVLSIHRLFASVFGTFRGPWMILKTTDDMGCTLADPAQSPDNSQMSSFLGSKHRLLQSPSLSLSRGLFIHPYARLMVERGHWKPPGSVVFGGVPKGVPQSPFLDLKHGMVSQDSLFRWSVQGLLGFTRPGFRARGQMQVHLPTSNLPGSWCYLRHRKVRGSLKPLHLKPTHLKMAISSARDRACGNGLLKSHFRMCRFDMSPFRASWEHDRDLWDCSCKSAIRLSVRGRMGLQSCLPSQMVWLEQHVGSRYGS